MLHPIDKWNLPFRNALDVDLKITWSKNVQATKREWKRRKQVHFNEKGNCACDNGKINDDQKIYASMAWMYSDDERKSENYADSLQLTNWILDSGETCHMTPEVSYFIPR